MTDSQTSIDKETRPEHKHAQASPHSAFGIPSIAKQTLDVSCNVEIEPITPETAPAFRRIIGLLLPIRYPDKFFAESVANATSSSLARVALWHQGTPQKRQDDASAVGQARLQGSVSSQRPSSTLNITEQKDTLRTIVGGIQCRIEQLPYHPSQSASSDNPSKLAGVKSYCYIQTLALLSAYRSKGIAAALLEVIIRTLCTDHCYTGTTTIYAHVWEEHQEALEWYVRRGFQVNEGVLKGYYRRLKPDGARVVWRDIGVSDHLRARTGKADHAVVDAVTLRAGD
ncbi:MAG: hypothetical protein Q9204_003728 [Flavoplaca sp. TL-2023a]